MFIPPITTNGDYTIKPEEKKLWLTPIESCLYVFSICFSIAIFHLLFFHYYESLIVFLCKSVRSIPFVLFVVIVVVCHCLNKNDFCYVLCFPKIRNRWLLVWGRLRFERKTNVIQGVSPKFSNNLLFPLIHSHLLFRFSFCFYYIRNQNGRDFRYFMIISLLNNTNNRVDDQWNKFNYN